MTFKTDQCLKSKEDQVDSCLTADLKKIMQGNFNPPEVLQILNEDICTDLVQFEGCFTRLFDECDNKEPVEFITGLLKNVIETAACGEEEDKTD